jgi:NADH-quinone oxidoreductase subunit L
LDQLVLISLVALGLPLLAFVLVIFNQRALGQQAHLIAIPAIAFSCVLSFYVAWVKLHSTAPDSLESTFEWIRFGVVPGIGALSIRFGVLVDNISVVMMVVVTVVSLLVHIYSSEYMNGDVRYARYFAYLGLFTFAMLGIVMAGNFLQLFIFWELVGFSSYSLIAHWYEREAPQRAGWKAFIINRIGDVFLWIGILLLYGQFHTFNFREIFGFVNEGLPVSFSFLGFSPETSLTIAGLLIFGGAVAKSAQFPLHVWLPDAMEGPTPVSALIHAATMVAAGVYLMARVFPLLTADAMLVIACTGAFTSFLAATIALAQNDIKRVLAYSTISQLGLMILAIGSGAVAAGMFHLVTHAAFKACLFLGSGSVIHAILHAKGETYDHETDAQDIRSMGGLARRMPITAWTFVVAALALTGLPLMAGFMSKDEILAGALAYGDLQGGIASAIPWVAFGVTMLTALYMWRQVFLVFFGTPAKPQLNEKIRESSWIMTAPLVVLAFLSLWFFYGKNPLSPESGWFLNKWIATPAQVIPPQTAPQFGKGEAGKINYEAAEETPVAQANPSPFIPHPSSFPMLPHQLALDDVRRSVTLNAEIFALVSAAVGFLIGWYFFLFRRSSGAIATNPSSFIPSTSSGLAFHISSFLLKGWYIDKLYGYAFVDTVTFASSASAWFDLHVLDGAVNLAARSTVLLSRLTGWFDRYVVDGIVSLVGATVQFLGLMARSVQTGRIQTYLTWVIAAVVVTFVIIRLALFYP